MKHEPRRRRCLATTLFLVLALGACVPGGLLETDLHGRLLDVGGVPVVGAVVFVPEGVAGSAFATTQVGDACQAPSEAFRASTCTDAEGRYALRVTVPLGGSLRLVFERLYWRAEATVDPGVLVPGIIKRVTVADIRFEALDPTVELQAAVRYALPGVTDFDLISLNAEKGIQSLLDHVGTVDANVVPVLLDNVPIRQPDGAVQFIDWTAYHHDLRELGVSDCALDPDTLLDVDCVEVSGPSLTFQGMPWMSSEEIQARLLDEKGTFDLLQNESLYQLSAISLMGGEAEGYELDATYYGRRLVSPHTPSSLQGLRSVLRAQLDPATVDRLLTANPGADYVLFNQIDVDLPPEDEDVDLGSVAAGMSARGVIAPSSHFVEDGIQYLRPVMVADATLYDAIEDVVLVPGYRQRIEAMVNRQDVIFAFLNLSAVEAPASLTSLTQWSNAFFVRTRLGGFRRFTPAGQERFSWPAGACIEQDNLLQAYRDRSRDSFTLENEYWVWWTNTTRYPGTLGCAGIGGFGRTPRQGGAAWMSLRNASNELTASTLMHETGHLLNASHADGVNRHQCRLLGIFDVGPNGPSLMVTGVDRATRTLCFAATDGSHASLRSRTKIAEHLHTRLGRFLD